MTIQNWPKQERPREKLLSQGAESLSVVELLAIFLRTGVKGKTAIDLARELLQHFGSLRKLLLAEPNQFQSISGFGQAKYVQLRAILELNKRYLFEEIKNNDALENSIVTHRYLLTKLGHRTREIFACLFLDSQLKVINYQELFHGSINEAEVHPREVVRAALLHNAASVIIAHNHPSGNPEPSYADIQLTRQIKLALELVQIKLLDHIIVVADRTYSFNEHGK